MLKLRELDKKDIPAINSWRNNPELIKYLGAPFRFINQVIDEKWYENYLASRSNTIRCSIVDESDDRILGLVSLTNIDYINRSAQFHIMIGDSDNQGKGIGTFAVTKMLDHAFKNMNLYRIELGVLESNSRAIHLYEKVGFVHEGTKRNSNYKNGTFVNMRIYSILKEEFGYPEE